MSADKEKAEALNDFLVSVLKIKTSYPQDIQLPKLETSEGEMSEGPIIQEKMPGVPSGHPQVCGSKWDSPESNEQGGKRAKPLSKM